MTRESPCTFEHNCAGSLSLSTLLTILLWAALPLPPPFSPSFLHPLSLSPFSYCPTICLSPSSFLPLLFQSSPLFDSPITLPFQYYLFPPLNFNFSFSTSCKYIPSIIPHSKAIFLFYTLITLLSPLPSSLLSFPSPLPLFLPSPSLGNALPVSSAAITIHELFCLRNHAVSSGPWITADGPACLATCLSICSSTYQWCIFPICMEIDSMDLVTLGRSSETNHKSIV